MTHQAPPAVERDMPLGRREQNKAQKYARILAAGEELLHEHGYDGMTMAQVAQHAGVAIGTVFQYATTKPELLMMVTAERWVGRVPELIDNASRAATPRSAIRQLVDPLVEAATEVPDQAVAVAREVLFGAAGPHRTRVLMLFDDLEEAVVQQLRTLGAEDEARTAARVLVSGSLMEVNRTRLGRAPEKPLAQRIDELVHVVLVGACHRADH